MEFQAPEKERFSKNEREAKLQKLHETQLALGKNIASTSQLLRFALSLSNGNMGIVRTQLETIRDIAKAIDEMNRPS